ncbi:response regulator receiver domain [Rhizobiaceae bacterium]|nr:response regulator receiver domain [Rhizobiaceae bacterium]
MTEATYESLIGEAFIKPIRSVLIVDDDYPTLGNTLAEPDERKELFAKKTWDRSHEERAKVRRVIDEFRKPDAPFLLDIHDASSPGRDQDREEVRKLQQTDLLVLDFQLDRSKPNDGALAVEIARRALSNRHFNLILVHTQEDLDRVFMAFVIGLLTSKFGEAPEPSDKLQAFLDNHETALLKEVGDAQYARAHVEVTKGTGLGQIATKNSQWSSAFAVLRDGGLHGSCYEEAAQYALSAYEAANVERFSKAKLDVVDWNDKGDRYIRARTGLLAFKHKEGGDHGGELLQALHRALVAWGPTPSRLVLTKLRAQMNEGGIEVQDDALGDHEVGAVWYLRLLEEDERNLTSSVARVVRNHAEQLIDTLMPEVQRFANAMRKVDASDAGDTKKKVENRFKIDLGNAQKLESARMGHNTFVGSKPVQASHLELGHILQIDKDYWICVTPACDLVPGQKNAAPHVQDQDRKAPPDGANDIQRFTALRLTEQTEAKALASADRGGTVFANISDTEGKTSRKAYTIGSLGEMPTWCVMYIENGGFLTPVDGKAPTCRLRHVVGSAAGDDPAHQTLKSTEAEVVGALRYEYALQIQSRHVNAQGRIGLGFEGSGR